METAATRRAWVLDPQRILIVRLGAIGDCLRAVPSVAALRRAFPRAEIGWAVGDLAAPLLRGHPDIDRLHVLTGREMRAGAFSALKELGRLGGELAEARYDIAIDIHTRFKSGFLAWASGAPTRIGLDRRSGTEANFLFTNRHVSLRDGYENRVLRFARMLSPLGLELADVVGEHALDPGPLAGAEPPQPPSSAADSRWASDYPAEPESSAWRSSAAAPLGVWVEPEALARGRDLYAAAGSPVVAIFPGTSASRADDRWPVAKWRQLVAELGRVGVSSMVLWGPGEIDVASAIAEASDQCRLAPPTTLPEMAAVLGCSGLYVGSNTAALHMAWMQGVPSVVLVGGRPWRTDRPLPPVPSVMLSAGGVEPAYKLRGEAARQAVQGIEPSEVLAAALRLLGWSAAPN